MNKRFEINIGLLLTNIVSFLVLEVAFYILNGFRISLLQILTLPVAFVLNCWANYSLGDWKND